MAAIDYGVLVIKNGILINHNMFSMDMTATIGWDDLDKPIDEDSQYRFANTYSAYIGDWDFCMGFYKYVHNCARLKDGRIEVFELQDTGYPYDPSFASRYNYQRSYRYIDPETKTKVHIKNFDTYGTIRICSLYYKGDHYKVIYGYGIENNYYIWEKIKVQYLGKKDSKKVQRLLDRYIKQVQISDTEFITFDELKKNPKKYMEGR